MNNTHSQASVVWIDGRLAVRVEGALFVVTQVPIGRGQPKKLFKSEDEAVAVAWARRANERLAAGATLVKELVVVKDNSNLRHRVVWEQGCLAIRERRHGYVVTQTKPGRGNTAVLMRFNDLSQAEVWAEHALKQIEAGVEFESDAARLRRFKDTAPPLATPANVVSPELAEVRRKFPWLRARFRTVAANPVAQVWWCTKAYGSRSGRKSPTGNHQMPVPHDLHEYAVSYIWQEGKTVYADAVRDEEGRIKVFHSLVFAEQEADRLYYTADEDERLSLHHNEANGRVRVFAYNNMEVFFDPAMGTERAFDIAATLTDGSRKAIMRDYSGTNRSAKEHSKRTFTSLEGAANAAIAINYGV